jgi:ABC-type antimicrobial peptide transport system permease subunit
MSPFRLILLSLRHFWKMNVAVACGVAVGTAVLTGALLVGDSMRGSLRDLVLAGLGNIDEVLVADHFFREQLAGNGSSKHQPAPVILQIASVEVADRDSSAHVDEVNLIGCDERFWKLGNDGPSKPPTGDKIVLNEPLARLLAVKEGDSVLVTIAKPGAIPAESAFGRKRKPGDKGGIERHSMRLQVAEVIRAEGLGRFTLRPNQRAPLDAFVSLGTLQEELNEPSRVNAIFRATPEKQTAWQPQLADYGIHIEQSPLGYIDITTDRLIFSPDVDWEIKVRLCDAHLSPYWGEVNPVTHLPDVQPALTYLANSITFGGLEVPYSTITAIDFQDKPPLGPFLTTDGKPVPKLGDDEIALNDWAADKLKAKIGDELAVTYYEPESTTGLLQERTVKLKLAAIIKLVGAAADKRLTPTVRGLTDKETIEEWDLPFKLKPGHIKSDDDQYWRKHAATPKAFVSLATGRKLWASRFGRTTSIRVRPLPGMTAETLAKQFDDLDPMAMGFVFQPIREMAVKASGGTTPFGVLFLSFSFFVIAAAVMLVLLLFRLGIQQRAKQLGLLMALGFRRRQVVRLFTVEGLIVAAVGSFAGVFGGIGYAALMLLGLRTWWLPAIGTPFLTLHVEPASPVIGFASGLALALIAIWFSVWRTSRIAPRRLLAGETSSPYKVRSAKYAVQSAKKEVGSKTTHGGLRSAGNSQFAFFNSQFAILFLLAIAPPLLLLFVPMRDDAKVGAFFGAGSWTLVLLLVLVYRQLRRGATGPAVTTGGGNLLRMAARNAARNPGRSALAIGLTAAASFLIAAVSVFRVDPAGQATDKTSGSGGFALIGQSSVPIYYDLNSSDGRKELGANKDDAALLSQCHFYAFRVKPGDEASCLNLYKAKQPRMLGVGNDFIERGGFAWADVPDSEAPWAALERKMPSDEGPASAVLDQTTANYSLDLWKGRGERFKVTDARDRPLLLDVSGLLKDSIFQGELLLGEEVLRRYDPDVAGYRYFLIEAPTDKVTQVQQALQRVLGEYGFRTETTAERLSTLAGVENTYLATFQSLGGLGLLLGTIGLAVVQWRNVLERRGELALLRAAGYRVRSLELLVAAENIVLLVAGLVIGIVAALAAVLPQLLTRAGSIPWVPLGAIFATVFVTGLIVSLAAMRSVVRTPILASLREDR